MWRKVRNKLEHGSAPTGMYAVGMIVLVAFLMVAMPLFTSFSVASAKDTLEDNGYVIFSIGEYSTINTKLDDLKIRVDEELADTHASQYVYPVLAAPVVLPALSGGAWAGYGALTQVIPINTITSEYSIHGISVSAMSANANYVIRITYGAGDTEWAIGTITRSGVQIASQVIHLQGPAIPANSILNMQIADNVGTSTLSVKAIYHLEA